MCVHPLVKVLSNNTDLEKKTPYFRWFWQAHSSVGGEEILKSLHILKELQQYSDILICFQS